MEEYNSEFCNVKYITEDNIVLLTWKQFACLDNYKKPTTFACDLLAENKGSNFIVDATNGFEDDERDVRWGVSTLLPSMAKTDCKIVCFIMNSVNELEEEIDMWTKEFGKYFAVVKASSYEDAIYKMHNMLLVNVKYHIKSNRRMEFIQKLIEEKIILESRREPGNYCYEVTLPIDSDNEICILEIWTNSIMQEKHGKTKHYEKLALLKQEYVEQTDISKHQLTM